MSQVQHSFNAEEISLTSNKNDSYILNISKMHIIRVCKNLKDNECITLIILVLVSHFNFYLFRVVDQAGYPSAFYSTLHTHYRIVSYHIVRNFT